MLSSRKEDDLEAAAADMKGEVDGVRGQRRRARCRGCRGRRPPSSASGRLDILVNNAATNPYMGPTIDVDLPRYDKTSR